VKRVSYREIAGWVLLGTGLAVFALTYFVFLREKRIIEAIPMAFIGFIVIRVGLQVIKVAVAAQAAAEFRPAKAGTPRPANRPVLLGGSPADPTPNVIPGRDGQAVRSA
jgi:xanthine/uracil permease